MDDDKLREMGTLARAVLRIANSDGWPSEDVSRRLAETALIAAEEVRHHPLTGSGAIFVGNVPEKPDEIRVFEASQIVADGDTISFEEAGTGLWQTVHCAAYWIRWERRPEGRK